VPVLLQVGHLLWRNDTGLQAPIVGFALAPSLAFFLMTWDNLITIVVYPCAGVRSDHTWTRWGQRKPWILIGVPLQGGWSRTQATYGTRGHASNTQERTQ
jgi:MFS transporter